MWEKPQVNTKGFIKLYNHSNSENTRYRNLSAVGEPIKSTTFITFSAKKITALMPFLYDAFKPRVYDPKIIWKVFLVDQYEYDLWGSITV